MAKRISNIDKEEREQNQIIDIVMARGKVALRKSLRKANRAALGQYRRTGMISEAHFIQLSQDLEKDLKVIYSRSIDAAGARQRNLLEDSKKNKIIEYECKQDDTDNEFERDKDVHITENAAAIAAFMALTSKKEMANKINQIESTGDFTSRDMVADQAQFFFDGREESRALSAADTVAHDGVNFGGEAMVGIVIGATRLKKKWVTKRDGIVRASHRIADGQTVPLKETFIVDFEHLKRPGDPAGSAANIIKCRCFLTFSVI